MCRLERILHRPGRLIPPLSGGSSRHFTRQLPKTPFRRWGKPALKFRVIRDVRFLAAREHGKIPASNHKQETGS
jgi:hypothetical protein